MPCLSTETVLYLVSAPGYLINRGYFPCSIPVVGPLVRGEEVTRLRTYELLYIIKPDLDAEKTVATVEKFAELVKNNKGEVVRLDQWGKRRLAYELQDYREGFYVLMQFKAEPALASEVERILKISDNIIKYLITRMGEDA
jgi:small subunit ribosomal protein S6